MKPRLVAAFVLLLTSSSAALAQTLLLRPYSATFEWNQRFYYYQLSPDATEPDLWSLVVSTVSNPRDTDELEANKVFSTDVLLQVAGERITHLRIYGATPLDYAWAVSRSEYFETAFQWTGGQVRYTWQGRKLGSPKFRRELPPQQQVNRFNPGRLTIAEGVELAVRQFVKHYEGSLFRFPDQPGEPSGQLINGQLELNGQQYTYELRRNFFNPGDDNLSIRKAGQGLVYNTLVKIQEDDSLRTLTLDIHHVQLSHLSWAVFARDYLRGQFNLGAGQVAWQKVGDDMRKDENAPPPLAQFDPALSKTAVIDLALRDFIVQYHPAFVR
ncbi:MAG: hypothetical protein MUC97_17155 [Bernardetiaceae bacterium]|jgi:hypothetical protein|nr:hypothetical protein [Bernardetiaceae bacterium]